MDRKVLAIYGDFMTKDGKIVIPEVWIPYVSTLKIVLKVLKIFTSDKIDAFIDQILLAIEVVETSSELKSNEKA
jgi:hypothetical protein